MLPQLSEEVLAQLLYRNYCMKGCIKQLAGYTDLNYLVTDRTHPSGNYLFKVSSSDQDKGFIQIQTYILLRIKQLAQELKLSFPEVMKTVGQADQIVISSKQYEYCARMFRFVEGSNLSEVKSPSVQLLTGIGVMTAKLSLFLAAMTAKQEVQDLLKQTDANQDPEDLLMFPQRYKEEGQYLEEQIKSVVGLTLDQFNKIIPRLTKYPLQLIHNDIAPSNLLVEQTPGDYLLRGLIDFGDMAYSYRLVELAIAAAQVNMDPENPLRNAMLVIQGYSSVVELTGAERALIFPLMKGRLAFLAIMICRDCHFYPGNEHLRNIRGSYFTCLKVLSSISGEQFETTLQKHLADL